eukprot:gene6018-10020_t
MKKRSRTETEKENLTKTTSLKEFKAHYQLQKEVAPKEIPNKVVLKARRQSESISSPRSPNGSSFLQKLNGLSLVDQKNSPSIKGMEMKSNSLKAIPKIAVYASKSLLEDESDDELLKIEKSPTPPPLGSYIFAPEEKRNPLRRRVSFSDLDSSTGTDTESDFLKVDQSSQSSFSEEEMEERRLSMDEIGHSFIRRRSSSTTLKSRMKKLTGHRTLPVVPNLTLDVSNSSTSSSPESPMDGLISPGVFVSPRPFEIPGNSEYSLQLPKIDGGSIQDCNCITPETMNDVLTGKIKLKNKYKIIDCRFPYEYNGGHIKGAQNLYLSETLEELFFKNPQDIVLIFHCEFSKERGPKIYRTLREIDRKLNEDVWPKLYYPEIYLLNGGFKNFYETMGHQCKESFEPQCSYTPMDHINFSSERNEYFKEFRSSSAKVSRRGKSKSCNFNK